MLGEQSPAPRKQTEASLSEAGISDMGSNSIGVYVCVCEGKSGAATETAGTSSRVAEDKSRFRMIVLPKVQN